MTTDTCLENYCMAGLVWQCWHFSLPLWHWDWDQWEHFIGQILFVATCASSITCCQSLQFYTRGPPRVSLISGVIWTRGPLRVSLFSGVIWRTVMVVCHYISFATLIPGARYVYVHKGYCSEHKIRLHDQRSWNWTSLWCQAMNAESVGVIEYLHIIPMVINQAIKDACVISHWDFGLCTQVPVAGVNYPPTNRVTSHWLWSLHAMHCYVNKIARWLLLPCQALVNWWIGWMWDHSIAVPRVTQWITSQQLGVQCEKDECKITRLDHSPAVWLVT